MAQLPSCTFPDGLTVPAIGQGTWGMGEDPRRRSAEIAALRLGLDLGLTLIDTAEMYADGGAEEVTAEAIAGRRDDVILVSKVLPHHADKAGTIAACENSLARLKTDRIDIYLLHWRDHVALEETLSGLIALKEAGKIGGWGVSNFDPADMAELMALPGAEAIQTNQVLYNLMRRGVEFDLLPAARARALPIMAYSPIEQGKLPRHPTVRAIAERHGVAPATVALAWVISGGGVMAIPKAVTPDHVRACRAALELRMTPEDSAALDRDFPAPKKAVPLEMI